MHKPPAVEALELDKHISSSTATLTILNGLQLRVEQGERLAIIGRSGSGKSTLLALLAGLDLPSTGKVRILGEDIVELDEDGRAAVRGRSMGFVFQSFQLLPSLTALENVMLPLQLTGRRDAAALAQAALAQVGLSARLSHYPRQLSGGEQQRVAIARAFAPQPQILFADEPTGNLDASTGQHIIDLLFQLNEAAGTTLILVTHDMALASRCERILTLQDGQLQQVPQTPARSGR
ncbi:ATP-binding cassette domain-containing protein [Pseudomethylobacillus aquaticus]|uniref:ATP-binding cassette domain-containing protein n=1 Tax=Pseudomethylobacillus aquaticus TaxID=2676064 RepID=A0A3N0V5R0_9PROT|nr:ATP-binding cassette domain-containing protein [Pseudomethylobacillus aquaticus]ROH87932.1 ATP-binding cassette domain-containing protein [Pseudomethylobacillus aquaticus]